MSSTSESFLELFFLLNTLGITFDFSSRMYCSNGVSCFSKNPRNTYLSLKTMCEEDKIDVVFLERQTKNEMNVFSNQLPALYGYITEFLPSLVKLVFVVKVDYIKRCSRCYSTDNCIIKNTLFKCNKCNRKMSKYFNIANNILLLNKS